MSRLLLPTQRFSQPGGRIELDRLHPLITGAAEPMLYAGGTHELCSNAPVALSYGSIKSYQVATPLGKGLHNYIAGMGLVDLSVPVVPYGTATSVTFWAGYWTGVNGSSPCLLSDSGTSFRIIPSDAPSGGNWKFFSNFVTTDSGEALVPGQYYVFVMVRTNTTGATRVYCNGVHRVTATATSWTTNKFVIGSAQAGNSYYRSSCTTLLAGRLKGRAWSDAEVAAFSRNIWQITRPNPGRIWVDAAAAGGAGTTAVAADLMASYAVRGVVDSNATAAYALRGVVAADVAGAYAVQTALTSESTAAYALRVACAGDLSVAYALRAGVASDIAPSYALRGALASDVTATYALRAGVQASLSASYSVQTVGAVASSITAGYALRGAVAADASAAYVLRGALQTSLSGAYHLQTGVGADASAAYLLRSALQSDLHGAYALLTQSAVASDLSAAYLLLGNALWPASAAVLAGVHYGPGGIEFVGTLGYPTAAEIAAAVLASLQANTIAVNMVKIKGSAIGGDGTEANPWGPG